MTDKPKHDGRVWPRHKVDEALKMLEQGISRRMVAKHFNSSVTTMRAAFIRHGVYKPMPSHQEMKDRIEQLENGFKEILAASQVMAFGPDIEKALHLMIATHRDIARAALGEKKDV